MKKAHTAPIESCLACRDSPQKEYLLETFHGAIDFIRWRELVFMVILFFFSIQIFGYFFGIVIALVVHFLSGNLEGGAVADIFGEWPAEEFPPNTCSRNIENCNLCNNEYNHDFNVFYESNKWYRKIWN